MTAKPETLFDRSTQARIGITLLNILLPGLGLIRLGHGREGGLIAASTLLASWLLAGLCHVAPVGSFAMQVSIYTLFLLLYLLFLLFSLFRTWPRTRRDRGDAWWSRWYAIILWCVVSVASSAGSSTLTRTSYRTFYIASVSMAPTFIKNEKIVADMRWRTPQIGNILMVLDKDGVTRIYRVAAIGGQTFAMRNGVPIIDGHPATQAYAGEMTIADTGMDEESGRRMHEHFPGETGSHDILQLSGYPQDDVAPVRIPAGSLYLLGDDRDLSADSRIPYSLNGVGIVPVSAIIGRPLYIAWSKDHSRIGQRADH
jgi:signal peptidase I